MQMPNELITMDYLGTFAGLVVVVALIVQFTKVYIKSLVEHVDEAIRIYSLIIALGVQIFVIFVTQGQFTVENVGLAILNSFLIALTAIGIYHTFKPQKVE